MVSEILLSKLTSKSEKNEFSVSRPKCYKKFHIRVESLL
jgi:hypothetical protein